MRRIIEVEFETTAVKVETAFNRFFAKYPQLSYWREEFEYMLENNKNFDSDYYADTANHIVNLDWRWALHLNINEHIEDNGNDIYMCVIERA